MGLFLWSDIELFCPALILTCGNLPASPQLLKILFISTFFNVSLMS